MTRLWSEKELELLVSLYQGGQSITHLSDLFRRTPASVRLKLSRLGVKRGSHKKENGKDLLADLVGVLRGESAPQDPLIRDFFTRLHLEHQPPSEEPPPEEPGVPDGPPSEGPQPGQEIPYVWVGFAALAVIVGILVVVWWWKRA